MLLTKHATKDGARWARDSYFLPPDLSLSTLLEMSNEKMLQLLNQFALEEPAPDTMIAPIDPQQEVWAAGVTYLRSRDARRVERLFQIIKETATPMGFGDAERSGAGLPNAVRALGLKADAEPMSTSATSPDLATEVLRRLLQTMGATSTTSVTADTAATRSVERAPNSVARGPASSDPQLSQIRTAMIRAGLL